MSVDAVLIAWMPDADPQSHVIFAKMSVNAAQTVVPSMPAPLFDTDFAESEVELIVQNDDVFRGDFEVPGGFSDGPSGFVHEGRRFHYQNFSATEVAFRRGGLKSTTPCTEAMAVENLVHRHEPDIVTIPLVFGAGVSQAHNQ